MENKLATLDTRIIMQILTLLLKAINNSFNVASAIKISLARCPERLIIMTS